MRHFVPYDEVEAIVSMARTQRDLAVESMGVQQQELGQVYADKEAALRRAIEAEQEMLRTKDMMHSMMNDHEKTMKEHEEKEKVLRERLAQSENAIAKERAGRVAAEEEAAKLTATLSALSKTPPQVIQHLPLMSYDIDLQRSAEGQLRTLTLTPKTNNTNRVVN